MAAITVRNLPDEVHRSLKVRARSNGRSTEAEVRAILVEAASPPDRVQLGSLLAEIGRDAGGVDLPVMRDREPQEPVDLT